MAPSIAHSTGTVVAFIDMGTYSVRLLIARFNPNQSHTILSEVKEPSRLGVGEIFEQRLEQQAMQRTALVCSKFVQMAKGFRADPIIAVATAATRDARNKRQFLRLLQKEAGLNVRVVSGEEEARLIYLGVSRGMHLDGQRALFVDIGGGSTELIIGDDQDYHLLASLAMGSIRLSQAFRLNDPDKPIPSCHYAKVCRHVQNSAVRTIQSLRAEKIDLCVGSSGTLINLAEISTKLSKSSSSNGGPLTLNYKDLCKTTKLLCSLPLEERRKVPGINSNRADILLGGAAIIESLMQQLEIPQLTLSQRGLRDGLLIDYQERLSPTASTKGLSTRLRSVLLLGRRCGFAEGHAQHVTKLSFNLFDATSDLELHHCTFLERELLQYAALLHDIGVFLSFHKHHAHTYYLIKNADLVGFDQTEIAMMAAVARYHRKGTPRPNDPEVSDLDEQQIAVVYQLGVLLRIAETLDRSHSGVIKGATLQRADSHTVAMELHTQGDCSLEMWAVHKHAKAFKKAFGHHLIINLAQVPPLPQSSSRPLNGDPDTHPATPSPQNS